MSDAFWTGFFAFLGLVTTAIVTLIAKRQSSNSAKLDSIEGKVNGQLDKAVREARWEANPQVLIVDDCRNDLDLMAEEFKPFDADVSLARNSAEAISLIRKRIGAGRGLPFDLILLDLRLGSTSGADVAEILAVEAPWVPVVVITGGMSSDLATPMIERRTTPFLGKPLDRDKIKHFFHMFKIRFQEHDEPRPRNRLSDQVEI